MNEMLGGGKNHKCPVIDGDGEKIKLPEMSDEVIVWSINNNQAEYLCLVNNLPHKNSSESVSNEWSHRFQSMISKAREALNPKKVIADF